MALWCGPTRPRARPAAGEAGALSGAYVAQVFALTATQIFATIREGQVVDPGSPYLTFNGFW
mgnify:CR=1 FL=1